MRLVGAVVLGLAVCGCDEGSQRFEALDTPTPVPQEVEAPPDPAETLDASEEARIKRCARGTGRKPDGECTLLNTRVLDHVQQVQMPSGRFVMGDAPESYDAVKARTTLELQWTAQPRRLVDIEPFWIDLWEVTREAYAKCVAAGACTPAACPHEEDPVSHLSPKAAGNAPQTCVTHAQAQAFCASVDGALPTEPQWEYAARGVDARLFPWGSTLRDEVTAVLMPVVGALTDGSYFGIRGLGSNADEWVAEAFAPDTALAEFVDGPFRSPGGPLATAEKKRPGRHIVKAARAGARRFASEPSAMLGFRCAAPVGGEGLVVPAEPPAVPLVLTAGTLSIFQGVAEAVDRSEAKRYCEVLNVAEEDAKLDDWRLPTFTEVKQNGPAFKGPGPFWTTDGAAAQRAGNGSVEPTDPWALQEARVTDALAARCVRP